MPVTAKSISGATLSVDSGASISSPGSPFAIRQGRHEGSRNLLVIRIELCAPLNDGDVYEFVKQQFRKVMLPVQKPGLALFV
jgi:hypothetical protein